MISLSEYRNVFQGLFDLEKTVHSLQKDKVTLETIQAFVFYAIPCAVQIEWTLWIHENTSGNIESVK